ncbi:coniferyl-alcohol dehydrogenase [Amycolatopsis sp. A1MSW2902]|uniref:coniferyl-alcohol dehydrogenase n=1 Tax=Amycolatopsis sp. A1MSW2902 TaxID=687413 RepID=UPI00307DC986
MNGFRCVVTGAASGVGREVAARLLAGGASVVALDRAPCSERVRTVETDLADPASIDAALASLDGEFDALLNVAGVPGTPHRSDESVLRVNFLGPRHLTERMLDRLRPGGAIVNVASLAASGWSERRETIAGLLDTGSVGEGVRWYAANRPDGLAYTFSKEALVVYTMAGALRLRERGLRMNAVLPGAVDTPMLAEVSETMGTEMLDGVRAVVGRHATPADIAPAVVFLASRDARWIVGSTLVVDGGLHGAISSGLVPAPTVR